MNGEHDGSSIKDDSYISIQSFMVKELHLSGNELIVYAIIFGFSQAEGCWFTGSRKYIADWCQTSKRSVSANLKKLMNKGLIERRSRPIQDVLHYDYRVVRSTSTPLKKVPYPLEESSLPPLEESSPNTIDTHNLEDSFSMLPGFLSDDQITEAVIEHLNNVAGTSYRKTTEAYRKLIKARLKDGYTFDDFITVIDKKCDEWLETSYAIYIKPTTLFAKSHFEDYLKQPEPRKRRGGGDHDDGWSQSW